LETDVRRCLVESGQRSSAAAPRGLGDEPVRAAVTCYRLDGPAAAATNSPHRNRDRTSRIP
jgi:hypothetical protein